MIFYRLNYDNYTQFKVLLRKILLIGAIIADFFAICSIIEIAVEGAIYIIQLAALIILSTVLRVISMRLLVLYEYKYCNKIFTVTASNSLSSKIVFEIDNDSLFCLDICGNFIQKENNCIDLCGNCSETKYILKIEGKKYLLALDEYMYALLNNLHDERSEHDIL